MILVVAVLAVVAAVPLLGGSLRRAVELDLGWRWTLVLAIALQIATINVFPGALRHSDAVNVHLYTYWLAVAFLLLNRHVRGFAWIAAGAVLNLLPIAANGGVMPASASALRLAGLSGHGSAFTNSTAVAHARLAFLGDVFAVPRGLPLANVFSIGDVVLVIGVAVVLHRACGSRLMVRSDSPHGERPKARAAAREHAPT